MRATRRGPGITSVALILLATGCLASSSLPVSAKRAPHFDPIAFFSGTTRGEGVLHKRFGSDRTLSVRGTGLVDSAGVLTLDQVIRYTDGGSETRRWVVSRIDSTHYKATLSDASGEVTADASGNQFHLRYRIRSPRVYMEQWLVLSDDGRTADNRAQVTVLGIPWMRLSERIVKVQ